MWGNRKSSLDFLSIFFNFLKDPFVMGQVDSKVSLITLPLLLFTTLPLLPSQRLPKRFALAFLSWTNGPGESK